MKKVKMVMTAAFVLAIGAAFASGEQKQENLFYDSYELIGDECVPVTSGCTPTGTNNCTVIVYQFADPCRTLLLKHP